MIILWFRQCNYMLLNEFFWDPYAVNILPRPFINNKFPQSLKAAKRRSTQSREAAYYDSPGRSVAQPWVIGTANTQSPAGATQTPAARPGLPWKNRLLPRDLRPRLHSPAAPRLKSNRRSPTFALNTACGFAMPNKSLSTPNSVLSINSLAPKLTQSG